VVVELQRILMTAADLDWVVATEQASYPYPWTRGIFADCLSGNYLCWIAQSCVHSAAPDPRGYLVASVAVGECHLLNICVAPQSRGVGVADYLIHELIAEAAHLGAGQMFLEVRPSNLAAQKLYQRFGFVEVGRRKNYYPAQHGREDALIWMRNLE
jgi:ribosomal-protein-alanine N-acetyltransferase